MKRFVAVVTFLSSILASTDGHSEAPQWRNSVVFKTSVDAPKGEMRIPSIVRAQNGRLIAFAERRVFTPPGAPEGLPPDKCDIDIAYKTSDDNGATWSAMSTLDGALDITIEGVLFNRYNTYHNPVPILDPQTGYLYVFYNLSFAENQSLPTNANIWQNRILMRMSTDHGATWSQRFDLTNELTPADSYNGQRYRTWMGPGPGIFLMLQPGSASEPVLIVPFRYTVMINGKRTDRIGFIYKEPGASHSWKTSGHFFQQTALDSEGNFLFNLDEVSIASIGASNLYLNARDQNADGDHRLVAVLDNSGKGVEWLDESHVHDNVFQQDPSLVDPRVHASLLRIGPTTMLFANPATKDERRFLTIRRSLSETQTTAQWTRNKLLTDQLSGYSAMVYMPGATDDLYNGVLFETGKEHYNETISFVAFSHAWAFGPTLVDWTFDSESSRIAMAGEGLVNDSSLAFTAKVQGSVKLWGGNVGFGGTSWGPGGIAPGSLVVMDKDTNDSLDFGDGESFSIAVRFRTYAHASGGAAGSGSLISKDAATSTVPSWWLRVRDGQIQFYVNDGVRGHSLRSEVPGGVSDNEWHDVLVHRDALDDKLYIVVDGGQALEKTDGTQDLSNGENVTIGNFNHWGRQFRGDIDYIKVSSYMY